MLLVGLTGGIGSGKSTVARLLEERGAVVIDADELARQAVEPGTHGYAQVLRRFGPPVVSLSGDLDRERLAAIVFKDRDARRDLEAIIHPEVGRLFREATERYRATDRIVVYVVPLLVESGLQDMFEAIVVINAQEDRRIERLVSDRAMDDREIRDRIAAQLPDEERERAATHVLRNDGSRTELEIEVDNLWAELSRRAGDNRPL
jgi:dephospho-CoA kinase